MSMSWYEFSTYKEISSDKALEFAKCFYSVLNRPTRLVGNNIRFESKDFQSARLDMIQVLSIMNQGLTEETSYRGKIAACRTKVRA